MSSQLETKQGVAAGFVTYPGAKGQLQGYLARPSDSKSYPGVILVQEWWGIEPHIKQLTERLAREGFVVLAPDLYHGRVAKEPSDAEKEMMALNKQAAVEEITRAIAYLQGRDDVSPKKLGMTGFCMGGFLTWLTAEATNGQLAAIAPFYAGFYEPTVEDIRRVSAPVLAVWGSEDASIPAEARDHIVSLLEQEGKTFKALVLDAPHAFMNDTRPRYRKEAADEAWKELVAWLDHYLRA
ncbi:Carboxymethylenebutenolidase [compost metagenome]